jgi:hypothetical protein
MVLESFIPKFYPGKFLLLMPGCLHNSDPGYLFGPDAFPPPPHDGYGCISKHKNQPYYGEIFKEKFYKQMLKVHGLGDVATLAGSAR